MGREVMMTLVNERPSWRMIERWAIQTLLEAGAIKKCHHHGYMQCRGDPNAHIVAFGAARDDPPIGLSPEQAVAALQDVLGGVGDICPDC